MRFSCLQTNLDRGLRTVGRAVATRSTMPITQCVLMRTDNGMLMLAGTNLEMAIQTHVGAMIEEEGEIAVPYKLLSEWVGSRPDDRIDIELTGDGDNKTVLDLRCGRASTRINCASANDFPPPPQVDPELTVNIDAGVLRNSISMVAFSAATDESRPVLTGVQMTIEGDQYVLATADGFRLSVLKTALPEGQGVDNKRSVIIPARAMTEAQRLLGDRKGAVRVALAPERGQAMFEMDGTTLVSQLVQGTFPDYNQLIPDSYETRLIMDQGSLKRATQSAGVFAKDGSNIVRLEASPNNAAGAGNVQVSARSEEVGDSVDVFHIDQMDGEEAKIAFNLRYLSDVCNVMGGNIALEINNSSSPGVFRTTNEQDYVHVVMPMYVQW